MVGCYQTCSECRKTKFVSFHSVQNTLNEGISIEISYQHIKQVKYAKFSGFPKILIGSTISCELSKKLSRTCGIFFRIRHLLPTSVLASLYNSLFSSFLQYGIIVLGLTYEVHTKLIHLLQRKVARTTAPLLLFYVIFGNLV